MRARALLAALALSVSFVAPAGAQDAPPVDVATPLVREIVDFDIYTGRFEAVQEVEIRARVSGYLKEVLFTDGDIVTENSVLFVIDQEPFKVALARAEASLAAAEAALELAEVESRRALQLAERNVGTEQEVDRTRAALAEAEGARQVAAAELRQANLDLDFTEVRAPFAGRMSDSKIDRGNLVIGGASNATLLSTIVSTDPIHFVFTASEADFLRYSRLAVSGQRRSSRNQSTPIAVRLMDEDEFVHEGAMNFVDNRLDPNSGTITGRAILPNPGGFLVPGIFGRLRLPGSGPYEAHLIPDSAILSDQARKIVMVVDGEGKVSARPVQLGPMHRGLRVVREGLSVEDRVVVNGVQRARPGAQVTPQTVELSLDEE